VAAPAPSVAAAQEKEDEDLY